MLEILQRFPFRYFTLAKAALRRRYATVDWPEYPDHITLTIDAATLEEQLRRHHFEDASGWSLRYDGEVLNMRRPAGRGLEDRPIETHLRFRETDAGLEGNGHVEPSRWEANTAHVHEEGMTWLDENELRSLLEDCGIDVETLEV